jgi:hypothetical protein
MGAQAQLRSIPNESFQRGSQNMVRWEKFTCQRNRVRISAATRAFP